MMKQSTSPTQDQILQIGTGFWPSKILLSAIHFELFTKLAQRPQMSGSEIKVNLGLKCTDRHLFDFLDALTGFGFLTREGLLASAMYSNSADTDTFLDKNKPTYIGGILEMMNDRLYGFWGNLEEGLRTGLPQNEVSQGQRPIFEILYDSPDLLRGFVNAMTGMQVGNFDMLAQRFDFSNYQSFLDVGGSAGVLATMVAQHNPHMRCRTLDLPPVQPLAEETIKKYSLGDRVEAISSDFFKDKLPAADVIAMGNILHDWSEEKKLQLMKSAYDALPEGGAFLAIEAVIDNERRQNVFGLMMSLNMLIETGEGFDYTFDDFNKWVNQIGFQKTEIIPLTGPSSAVVAYK